MNTSIDEQTNKRSSDRNQENRSINLSVFPFGRSESIDDGCRLFNDDDEDDDDDNGEDNLMLLDLKMKNRNNTDLNLKIFDELEQQCQAVLKSTSNQCSSAMNESTTENLDSILSNHMKNDYERRFEESLQKLIIPSWFVDHSSASKKSDKPTVKLIVTDESQRAQDRTPEIIHVRRPQTTRSCRSSLASSPSPSLHSWHPRQMIDAMNFSAVTSSSSINRRSEKYEKAIDRVTKSSRWYQPSQFVKDKNNKQISVFTVPSIKMSNENENCIQHQQVNGDQRLTRFSEINDVNREIINEQNSSRYYSMTKDKLGEKSKVFDESSTMPLDAKAMSFDRVELEEVTDDEEAADKLSFRRNSLPTENAQETDAKNISKIDIVEQFASDQAKSILDYVLQSEHISDDRNSGVRELSDDENQFQEIDENDINETDEFILFPTHIDSNDHEQSTPNSDQQQSRGSLNRLYTFSRISDESMNGTKAQDSLTSDFIITDKDISNLADSQAMNNDQTTPIYRSHIQKRNINLGRYYDGMMRASHSQLPTYDLRMSLVKNSPTPIFDESKTSEGVTEETVRKARVLLDSIPDIIDPKLTNDSMQQHQTTPVRSILKQTRFATADQIDNQKNDHELIDKTKTARRTVRTTITEEYHRIQRQIIEEIDQEVPQQQYTNVLPSVQQDDTSIYESLSECYSGYSSAVSDFVSKPKTASGPSPSDEAYESDRTLSTSSAANVHPQLVHEFEYPSPPPPVPDRSLKPSHLRPAPPIKPRKKKTKTAEIDVSSQIAFARTIVSSASETSSSVRSMSSRHYCGSLPIEHINASNRARDSTSTSSTIDKQRPIKDQSNPDPISAFETSV